MLYLVISGDDDLRVAEPRHLLARGEAAVRLLDERGQVVDASSTKLFQNLDLEEAITLTVRQYSVALQYVLCKQPVAKVTCRLCT